jgi:hypothetical protein
VSLDSIIDLAKREVRGCDALALVDIESGAVIASAFPRAAEIATSAAAAFELLAAPLPPELEGELERGAPEQVTIATPRQFHVIVRSRAWCGAAYIAICSVSTGLGVILADLQGAIALLEAAA